MSGKVIKSIEGTLNALSSSTVTSHGANAVIKAGNLTTFDYIEVDNERYGNFVFAGPLADTIEGAIDKKLTIQYHEPKNGNVKTRLVVGIQLDGERIEVINPVELEPVLTVYKAKYNVYMSLSLSAWMMIGGFLSFLVGEAVAAPLGWVVFGGGFVGLFMLINKLKKSGTKDIREVIDFANKHNRIK